MGALPAPSTPLNQARITQALSTTMNKHHKELIDQVSRHMVPYTLFSEEADGAKPATLQKNQTGATWSFPIVREVLDDTVDTDSLGTYSTDVTSDIFSSVHYSFPRAKITPVTLDWEEVQNNKGNETQIVDIVQGYAVQAMKSQATQLQKAVYATAAWNAVGGSELGRDRIKIIPLTVLVDNRGVIGGIDSNEAANAFWRSTVKLFDNVGDPATNVAPDDISNALNELFLDIQEVTGEMPNTLLVGRTFLTIIRAWAFEHNYNTQNRKETQELNIESFEFNGVIVTYDPLAPVDTCLALNSDYLFVKVQNDLWFKEELASERNPGNLTTSNVTVTRLQICTNKRNAHGKLVLASTVRPTGTPVAPAEGQAGAPTSIA